MSRTTREKEKQTLAANEVCDKKSAREQKSHVPGGIRTHAPCEIGALIQRLRPTRPRKLMHDNCIECSVLIRARLSHRQCVVFVLGCVSDRVTDWGQGFSNSACCSRGYIARFPASSSNSRFTARVQRDNRVLHLQALYRVHLQALCQPPDGPSPNFALLSRHCRRVTA